MAKDHNNRVLIVWTSGDKEVASKMVFMYALNSMLENWWDQVTLLVWGPSSKLLLEEEELMNGISDMLNAGVKIIACKQCADSCGVSAELAGMGIEVFYTGKLLTEWLKGGDRIITF
jgi:hypothetical protein